MAVFLILVLLLVPPGILGGELQRSVSRHGITWTFSEPVIVGQFVTGDYYVVGPVTIVSITPKPENGRNGSVLNLPAKTDVSGFDSRVKAGRYTPGIRAELPVKMKPGDALVSTISVDKMDTETRWLFPSKNSNSPVEVAAVLTCMDKEVSADAFRPSYCDITNIVYYAENLNKDLLPQLECDLDPAMLEEWVEHFQKPWIDVCFFGWDAPRGYMPDYGRDVARAGGIAALMLMVDFQGEKEKELREKLLIHFVQYGIDLWGAVRMGYPGWPAHGGHGNGRKLPIVFAGIMLGDEQMQSPKKYYEKVMFSEDMQTMFGKGWTGADVVYGGHVGPEGEKRQKGWGPYEHFQPRDWLSSIGEAYRRCCTSVSWVGIALAMRLLHSEEIWAHDAFFDYVDRWMTEDDEKYRAEIKRQTGREYGGLATSRVWDTFVERMWNKYRHNIPE